MNRPKKSKKLTEFGYSDVVPYDMLVTLWDEHLAGRRKWADSYFPPEDRVRLVRLVSHGEHLYHYVSYFFLMLVIFFTESTNKISNRSSTSQSCHQQRCPPNSGWTTQKKYGDVGDLFQMLVTFSNVGSEVMVTEFRSWWHWSDAGAMLVTKSVTNI